MSAGRHKKPPRFTLVSGVFWGLFGLFAAACIFPPDDCPRYLISNIIHNRLLQLFAPGLLFGLAFKMDSRSKVQRIPDEKMPDSERSCRQLIELSPAAIVVQSENQIVFVNPAGVSLFGGEHPEDLIGVSLWDFLSLGSEPLAEPYRQMLKAGETLPRAELEFVRLNGSQFCAEISAVPMLFKGKPSIQIIFRDITEQKRAEDELRQRNKELGVLYAIGATVGLSTDLAQMLQDALAEVIRLKIVAGEMFGMLFLLDESGQRLSLVAAHGAPPDHPCLVSPPAIGECLCGLAIQHGRMIICQDALADERHTRRWSHGSTHQDICVPLRARGSILGVMEIRLPHPYEIDQQNLQLLQAIADQIGVAVENNLLLKRRESDMVAERERIARELHDEFSQLLGYVTTKAMAVRLLLKNGRLHEADRNLLQLEQAARGLYVDVREAIIGLRMVGRRDRGLIANLKELTTHFPQLSGLPIDLTISPRLAALSLEPETEFHLMRIVQEALYNAQNHASPTRTWVSVDVQDCQLELQIGDDGLGFEVKNEPEEQSLHFGLRTMRERVAAIGASMRIESGVGQGTIITVWLPVEES